MKTIRFRLLVAALAVLMGSVIAKSQTADAPPPPPVPGGHEFGMDGHMMGFFADYLNLSDAQEAQMKSIMQKEHATMKPFMELLRQTRQELHQYEEGTFDAGKVRALAAQESQAQIELTVAHTRLHNELFQVLTPDQQAKMKEFEARREARMQQHMQSAPPAAPSEQ
jgi:periplasmic protein CpxP/Spy